MTFKSSENFTNTYFGHGIPLKYENIETSPLNSHIDQYVASVKCCPSQYSTSISSGGCLCNGKFINKFDGYEL